MGQLPGTKHSQKETRRFPFHTKTNNLYGPRLSLMVGNVQITAAVIANNAYSKIYDDP